jgi:hypothetical protein
VGVRRTPPSWLTWLVLGALGAVYVGERIVPQIVPARILLSGGGVLVVIAATAWRLVAFRAATGDVRHVERLFLLGYAGCVLSLAGFFLAGDGLNWLGIGLGDETASRVKVAATVLACIVLAASLLPAVAAQLAVPASAHDDAATAAVDRLRSTQLASAGLGVALAGAFLFLTGYVASARDSTYDVSYFRTSSPGTAARQIVESLRSPLRVLLFFPPANEVKDQVLGYFRALDNVAENVTIEQHDRLAEPELAAEHKVTQDGTIVLAVDDRSERLTVATQLTEARARLRRLDEDVQRSLMRVAREERTIYLTVGHGELNEAASATPAETAMLRGVNALRSLFGLLNYRVRDLSIQSGLGNNVPADAAMVLVLGPERPFLEPELQALDRYLARGGSALVALEPTSAFQLGPLRDRFGLEFRNSTLADDAQHLRFRGNVSDRRLIVTDRFTSHAAISTLSRAGFGSGILLAGAGYLEPAGTTSPAAFVIRSMSTTFADADGDFAFDEGSEQRKSYNVAAAVERDAEPAPNADGVADSAAAGPRQMRALVFADAELFSDPIVSSLGLNAALAADVVRWLGHEEELAGETTSEEDVPIVHTRAKDVAWFYSTILGAPSLVLVAGLLGVRRRRRRLGAEQVSS